MPIELKLPDVGEGIAEGEVVRWLVEEGSQVREDDPLVEIMTDKANVEIPSPVTGTLVKIEAQPGQILKVGERLAIIKRADETAVPKPAQATPAVRRLAKDLGVELDALSGTGRDGRVTEEDVRGAHSAKLGRAAVPAPPEEERVPLRGKRRMIAKKMSAAKATVPHVLLVDEADAGGILALRDRLREEAEREKVKVTVLPFILKAVVEALRLHPILNASLDEGKEEIVYKKSYDIGVAVDTKDGLMVPVVRDADSLSVLETAREIERLAASARAGTISPADLSGGTFTITSIGSIGGLFSYPIINVPESAILAAHRIVARPVVRDGGIVPREMMYLSLSFDHRIVDGGEATRFLNDLVRLIEGREPVPAERGRT